MSSPLGFMPSKAQLSIPAALNFSMLPSLHFSMPSTPPFSMPAAPQHLVLALHESATLPSSERWQLLYVLAFIYAALALAWRFLRPVVLRVRHPDSPPELPSWVPLFGHLFSFFKDYRAMMNQVHRNATAAMRPSWLVLAGKSMCFVVSPDDATFIHKQGSDVIRDPYVQHTARQFGLSPDGMRRMWKPSDNGNTRITSLLENLFSIARRELATATRPGSMYHRASTRSWNLGPDVPITPRAVIRSNGDGSQTVSLLRWVR